MTNQTQDVMAAFAYAKRPHPSVSCERGMSLIGKTHYRSHGHHVGGGSLAVILVGVVSGLGRQAQYSL
jgi:hypothetical protein